MKRLPKKVSRDVLLALPSRKWDLETEYDCLYLVPTRKKHDSNYMLQALVGVVIDSNGQKGEIAAMCDDICWSFPLKHPYDRGGVHRTILRTDCEYPSGIFRMWASGEHYFKGKFRVGASLSSTDVTLFVAPRGDASQLEKRIASL